MAKEAKDGYQVVGGDNVAGSLLGHIKTTFGPQGSKRNSMPVLSSAGFLRTPGLACCSGIVKVSPPVAWSLNDCSWLYKEADDADDDDA